jgi:15-cis-phytoene synthase
VNADACAALVARADPDRWRAAMAAPLEKRGALMALYAFNAEIARAPWAASDPLLGQIRLQWWTDAIEEIYGGEKPRRHEVVEPLARAIAAADLPKPLLLEAIGARLFDTELRAFEDVHALSDHVDHTAGHLMELAARTLEGRGPALRTIREFARGAGLAAFLRALPHFAARGRRPLPAGADIPGLVRTARDHIGSARARRQTVSRKLLPALLPGVLAEAQLRALERSPDPVAAGAMDLTEFERRARFAWVAVTGRW